MLWTVSIVKKLNYKVTLHSLNYNIKIVEALTECFQDYQNRLQLPCTYDQQVKCAKGSNIYTLIGERAKRARHS